MAPLAAVSHASPTYFRLEAIRHYAAALVKSIVGEPQIVATDPVEHDVDTVAGEPTNLLHEVRVLVVDRDAAQFPHHCGALRRARPIHLDAGQLRQLQHRRADATGSSMDQHALPRP